MGSKQAPRPRGRFAAAAAIAALACLFGAAPAYATTSFTGSALTCTQPRPVLDGTHYVFANDSFTCTLQVRVSGTIGGLGATGVSATVAIPADTTWSAGGDTHAGGVITFSSNLGAIGNNDFKSVTLTLVVADTATTGESIGLSAHLTGNATGQGPISADVPLTDMSSNAYSFTVAPPDADLSPSTLICQQDTPGPLFPGATIDCRLTAVNGQNPGTADTQNAVGVGATVPLGRSTQWLSGGTSQTVFNIFFGGDPADLGEMGLPGEVDSGHSGQMQPFQLTVSPSAPGGTVIAPTAAIGWVNQIRGTTGTVTIGIPAGSLPATSPGPAILQGSNVRCVDTNGGALVPGDDLTCTLTLVDQAGREDADNLNATISIPTAADWASGGSSHSASTVSFNSATLGTLPAGSSVTQVYHLTVDATAVPGTQIGGGGLVTGVSEPLTKAAITQPVPGNTLLIGVNPTVTGPPSADLSVAAAVDKPTQQPVKLPSKGTTPAHIVVTLSNAGPSIAQQPSFSVSLPNGAQFNTFDQSDTVSCGRVTTTKAVCTLAANALGAQSSASIGMGIGLSAITNDPGVRVIALSAASATPDPTANDSSVSITVQGGAPTLRAHSFTINVRPGKSTRASVLKHVTGRPAKAKFRVTVPKPKTAKKHSKKKPKPVKGAPRKGKVTVKGTTITYKAPRSAKGSDSFSYTFYDGLGHHSSATVKVKFVKPRSPKKKH